MCLKLSTGCPKVTLKFGDDCPPCSRVMSGVSGHTEIHTNRFMYIYRPIAEKEIYRYRQKVDHAVMRVGSRWIKSKTGKGKQDLAVCELHHTAMGNHIQYGITQCYLPPGRGDFPAFTPAEDGTRFSDPEEMQG